jgi:hypothetical protein
VLVAEIPRGTAENLNGDLLIWSARCAPMPGDSTRGLGMSHFRMSQPKFWKMVSEVAVCALA